VAVVRGASHRSNTLVGAAASSTIVRSFASGGKLGRSWRAEFGFVDPGFQEVSVMKPSRLYATIASRVEDISVRNQDMIANAFRTWVDAVERLSWQPVASQRALIAHMTNGFDYADALLAAHREFVLRLLEILGTGPGFGPENVAQDAELGAD
jgi:hypothetical protein